MLVDKGIMGVHLNFYDHFINKNYRNSFLEFMTRAMHVSKYWYNLFPNVNPSDYRLFWKLNEHLRVAYYANDGIEMSEANGVTPGANKKKQHWKGIKCDFGQK
jgi:hypothetical protein